MAITLTLRAESSCGRSRDIATREEVKRFSNHLGAVTAVAFQPEGGLLASACEDQYIRILDLNSGNEILKLKSYEGPPRSISFASGQMERFVSWYKNGTKNLAPSRS